MKKNFFALMAIAAALCACNKEQMIESETTAPVFDSSAPLVFTATMEETPSSKATFDNIAKSASWEVNDRISINGHIFKAKTAGTSTTFSELHSREIRPFYVSSESKGFSDDEVPQKLVDSEGTGTKWCANTNHKNTESTWDIVVKTEKPVKLLAIKLWNGNDTYSFPGRLWKDMKVSGRTAETDIWTEIKSCSGLNLEASNYGLAGTIEVNATQEYEYYKVEVFNVVSENIMQMSDMKFVYEDYGGSQRLRDIDTPFKAYFPAALYDGTTATLPSAVSETWADGKFNMPMYAHSENSELQFKNLCGVLKIIVKNDRISAVKSIRVSSANKAVSGAFTVNGDNAAVLTNPANTANTFTVTYSSAVPTTAEGTVFYVAIPAQTYRELKIEISSDGENYTKSMTTKDGADIVVARNTIYPVNHVYILPADALSGEFTVNSEGKKVHFSKGNLQATFKEGETPNYSWGFAENQYDCIGAAAGNTTIDSQTADAVVDLFGWSTSKTYYGINTSITASDYSGGFVDWGKNIGDGITWCTLSNAEWVYLIETRTASTVSDTANARYTKGTVNGIEGMIILPDAYTHPDGVVALQGINTEKTAYSENIYDLASWTKMESAGCVFLPAAGERKGSVVRDGDVGYYGLYWSSTLNSSSNYTYAYRLFFIKSNVNPENNIVRFYGCSVRLVTVC